MLFLNKVLKIYFDSQGKETEKYTLIGIWGFQGESSKQILLHITDLRCYYSGIYEHQQDTARKSHSTVHRKLTTNRETVQLLQKTCCFMIISVSNDPSLNNHSFHFQLSENCDQFSLFSSNFL